MKRGGRTIAGKAYLPDGSPAVGALVVANSEDEGSTWKPTGPRVEHQTTVDERGDWRLDDVEDKSFSLWASLPRLPDAEEKGIRAGRGDVRLRFAPPARISGTVVRDDGAPIPRFHVVALPSRAAAETPDQVQRRMEAEREPPVLIQDASGAFAVDGLVAGTYDVKVTTPEVGGGASQTVTIAAGQHHAGLRLVVSAGLKAVGKVLDAESGNPLENVNVSTQVGGRWVAAKTNAAGAFELTGLLPGETLQIEVRASTDSYLPEGIELLAPAKGTTVEAGILRLLRAADWQQRFRERGTQGFASTMRIGRVVVTKVWPRVEKLLAVGDTIVAVEGRDVRGMGPGAVRYLLARKPGTSATFTVEGPDGQTRSVTIEAAPP